MNVLDAAYWTGAQYPGGAEALGHRLHRPSLSDELNPNSRKKYKLGLQTAVDMQAMSGDYRVLYAMATELRHYPPLPMPELLGLEAPCASAVAAVAEEFGKLMQELVQDLADNKITDNELGASQQRWAELISKGQLVMQHLAAMNALLHARDPAQGGAP